MQFLPLIAKTTPDERDAFIFFAWIAFLIWLTIFAAGVFGMWQLLRISQQDTALPTDDYGRR